MNNNDLTQFGILLTDYDLAIKIVYHKKTKVMYAISCGDHNCGTMTRLDNADGRPLLYEE